MEKHSSKCQVICWQYIKRSAASVTHPVCSMFTHDPLLVYGVILDSCLEVPMNRRYLICWGVFQNLLDTAYRVTIYGYLSMQWYSLPNNSCHLRHTFSRYSLSTFCDAHTNDLVLMQFLVNWGRSSRLVQCYRIPAASNVNELFWC